MKAIVKLFLVSTISLFSLNSCGSYNEKVTDNSTSQGDTAKVLERKIDSASYKRGVEHSVNEKLLKKYKTKKKN